MRRAGKLALTGSVAAALALAAAGSALAAGGGGFGHGGGWHGAPGFGGPGFRGGPWHGAGPAIPSWALGLLPGWSGGGWVQGWRGAGWGWPSNGSAYSRPLYPYTSYLPYGAGYPGYVAPDFGYPAYVSAEAAGIYVSPPEAPPPYIYRCANPEGYYPELQDCDDWQQIYTDSGGTSEE